FGPARLALALAVAVMASLVVPAAAAASNAYLQFGAVKAGHYRFSGAAGRLVPGDDPTLSVSFDKRSATQSQSHSYQLTKGFKFSSAANLSSASASASLGRYGKISWRFRATGAPHTIKAPNGCRGPKYTSRAGTVTGSLK